MQHLGETIRGVFAYNAYENEILATGGDSNLVKKFSQMIDVPVNGLNLSVRIANIPHQDERHLGPVVDELPLVFCVHGLGGQLNQFEYLLDIFSYSANVVAIDLPGHGKSPYVDDWDAYTTKNYVQLCANVLKHKALPKHKGVFLVGHSMGGVICSRLAAEPEVECVAVAAVTPPFKDKQEAESIEKKKKFLYYVPPLLFDVFRAAVRVGGIASSSVTNMMGSSDTDEAILTRQLRTNLQSQTKSWLRTAYGFEFITPAQLQEIKVPILAIAAENDKVVPAINVEQFAQAAGAQFETISNAGHAVIIEKPRVVCALISDVMKQVEPRLDLAWQLQEIAKKTDKWSLKNEEKWSQTLSVGEVVGDKLRGMKTLRQDSEHSPTNLKSRFPDVEAVIDISREAPPYDVKSFDGDIKYFKFPTVAKIPPTSEEVKGFLKLVQSISGNVAVHCHYGFNRTGFLICCYLIEVKGYSVSESLIAYDKSRPTGIHHAHFIDELHLRYDL